MGDAQSCHLQDARVPGTGAAPSGEMRTSAPSNENGAPGSLMMAGTDNPGALCEPMLLSQLIQLLSNRSGYALLLSDLGALLTPQMRQAVKEKGGLRSMLQRYPQLFAVSGQPGKESVKLLLGVDVETKNSTNSAGAENLDPAAESEILQKNREADELNEAAVHLRGLPYRATVEDVKKFLGTHKQYLKGDKSVQFVLNRDGRPSGFARIQFVSPEAALRAKEDLHMKNIETTSSDKTGNGPQERYVEIFMFHERPSKLRFKKGGSGDDAPLNGSDVQALGITGTQVVMECRMHMASQGKAHILLSMLGAALSLKARQYLKKTEQGLKHFLSQYHEEFLVDGFKGRETIRYYPLGGVPARANCAPKTVEMPVSTDPETQAKADAASEEEIRPPHSGDSELSPQASSPKATPQHSVPPPSILAGLPLSPPMPQGRSAISLPTDTPIEGRRLHTPGSSTIGTPVAPVAQGASAVTPRSRAQTPAGNKRPSAKGPASGSISDLKPDSKPDVKPSWADLSSVPQTPTCWPSPSARDLETPGGEGIKTPSQWGTPHDVGARFPKWGAQPSWDAALWQAGPHLWPGMAGATQPLWPQMPIGVQQDGAAPNIPGAFDPGNHLAAAVMWTSRDCVFPFANANDSQDPAAGVFPFANANDSQDPAAGMGAAQQQRSASQQEQAQTLQKPQQSSEVQLRLRGLPYTASEQDVLAFFAKHEVVDRIAEVPKAVKLITRGNGKPLGLATVQMRSHNDAEVAIQALAGQYIQSRYIEIFHDTEQQKSSQQQTGGPKTGAVHEVTAGAPPGVFNMLPKEPTVYIAPEASQMPFDFAMGDTGGSGGWHPAGVDSKPLDFPSEAVAGTGEGKTPFGPGDLSNWAVAGTGEGEAPFGPGDSKNWEALFDFLHQSIEVRQEVQA